MERKFALIIKKKSIVPQVQGETIIRSFETEDMTRKVFEVYQKDEDTNEVTMWSRLI